MSKAKRNHKGKFVRSHSKAFIVTAWTLSVISLGPLWLASRAAMSDIGSFRSCNTGTGILAISSCGKKSLDLGDLIILGLLVLSACLSFSLLTGAWRATNKGTVIS